MAAAVPGLGGATPPRSLAAALWSPATLALTAALTALFSALKESLSPAHFRSGQLVFLLLEAPLALAVSLSLLTRFPVRYGGTPLAVYFVVGLVWFLCTLLPMLMTMDLAETIVLRCHAVADDSTLCGSSRSDPHFAYVAWEALYWLSFSNSWFSLPLIASFLLAGAFSVRKRVLFAIRDRVIFFLVLGALFGVCVIFLILRYEFSFTGMKGSLISLANCFGVFLSILMLSYGLIELPLWLLRFGNYESKLRSCEIRATATMERFDEARASLARVLGKINAAMLLYDNSKKEMPANKKDTVKRYMRLIKAEVPPAEGPLNLPRAIADEDSYLALTEDFLARLRYKTKKAVIEFRKVHYLWRMRCVDAFDLQDLLAWTRGELEVTERQRRFRYALRAYVLPVVTRLLAVGAMALTAAFIWSESTLWTVMLPQRLDLSPFSLLLHRTNVPYVLVQLVSFVCVSYLFMCLFFGLFRFKLFMLYELVPRHTDPFTLVLNAMLCSRLLIPLTYNFTTVMHETSYSVDTLYADVPTNVSVPITQFSSLHSSMEEVPVFGVAFNLYFPVVIVPFVMLTLCKVWDRVMNVFDMTKFSFEGVGDERLEAYGRSLIAQERTRWARNAAEYAAGGGGGGGGVSRSGGVHRPELVPQEDGGGDALSSSADDDDVERNAAVATGAAPHAASAARLSDDEPLAPSYTELEAFGAEAVGGSSPEEDNIDDDDDDDDDGGGRGGGGGGGKAAAHRSGRRHGGRSSKRGYRRHKNVNGEDHEDNDYEF